MNASASKTTAKNPAKSPITKILPVASPTPQPAIASKKPETAQSSRKAGGTLKVVGDHKEPAGAQISSSGAKEPRKRGKFYVI